MEFAALAGKARLFLTDGKDMSRSHTPFQPGTSDLESDAGPARPQRAAGAAEIDRQASSGDVILRPSPPPALKVTGPGRIERAYLRRIEDLEENLAARGRERATLRGELEVSKLVERGTARFTDRLERELEDVRHQGNRMMVALGSLQQENAALAAELQRARTALLEAPAPKRGWARLFPSRSKRR